MAKGGQRGLPKRPIRHVKTNSGGQKKGAKSILGSNPFRKVALEFFLFSACTLLCTKEDSAVDYLYFDLRVWALEMEDRRRALLGIKP